MVMARILQKLASFLSSRHIISGCRLAASKDKINWISDLINLTKILFVHFHKLSDKTSSKFYTLILFKQLVLSRYNIIGSLSFMLLCICSLAILVESLDTAKM